MTKNKPLHRVFIFLDWSNIYMRAKEDFNTKVLPRKIRKLMTDLFKDKNIVQTHLFASSYEKNEGQEGFFNTARKNGIIVHTEKLVERPAKIHCRECNTDIKSPICCNCGKTIFLSPHKSKRIDIALAINMLLTKNNFEEAILVSGDQDFIPVIRILREKEGRLVRIASFKSALSHDLELESDGSPIILDKYIDKIKQ